MSQRKQVTLTQVLNRYENIKHPKSFDFGCFALEI